VPLCLLHRSSGFMLHASCFMLHDGKLNLLGLFLLLPPWAVVVPVWTLGFLNFITMPAQQQRSRPTDICLTTVPRLTITA